MMVAKNWFAPGLCALTVTGAMAYGLATAEPSGAQPNPTTAAPGGGAQGQECLNPALAVCSDGQVIAILQAANQGEIDVAQSVVDRVKTPAVHELAQTIIDDHLKARDQIDQLVTSAGIEPVENDNSEELAESADSAIASLKAKRGSELEKSYVAHEILDHIQTIGTADHLLGPSAKNAQLKATIQSLRPTLVKHLQLASQAQTAISSACGGQVDTDAGTQSPDGG